MRYENSRPSVSEVHDYAAGFLQQYVGIQDHGRKCTAQVLISILFFAAALKTSIENACQRLRRAPTGQAAREALRATLPPMADLEARFNHAFAAQVPKGLRKGKHPRRVVIDLTQNPYYGQPFEYQRELRGGKPRQGTTRFHTYATAYLLSRGERFTLAMTYVWKDDSLTEVVDRLLRQVRKIGIRVRCLLLDRGFYSLDVVQHLKTVRCPFLVPVVRRGRRPKDPAKAKGPWQFFAWKKSGFATHTLKHKGRSCDVEICVSRKDYRDSDNRRKRRTLVFAFWGIRHGSPRWFRETYRERFGVETGYRQMQQGRARTWSRNPQMRLLMVGIALLLRNAWVWFHLVRLAQRLRGGHLRLHLESLRLPAVLDDLLIHAIALLGYAEIVNLQPLSLP